MNGPTDPWRLRPVDLALFLLACAVGVLAFWQSHQRWLDPIIDVGRDLYIPEQIAGGKKLYRDFTYNYPPLAPYLLAGVVSLAGSSLRIYVLLGAAVALTTAAALYWICAITTSRVAATLASLLFFGLNFASGTGFNYLFPYSHALVFGVMFVLLTAGAVMHYLLVRTCRWVLLLGLLFALAATWSRVESAALVIVLVLLATTVYRAPLWLLASYLGSVALTAFAVHFYFSDVRASPWNQIFPESLLLAKRARDFHAIISGVADWRDRLPEVFLGFLLLGSVCLLLGRAESRLNLRRPVIVFILVLIVFSFLRFDVFFRSWPMIAVALAPLAVGWGDRSPLLLLLTIGLLGTSRVWLNNAPIAYGFALTVLIYPLVFYVLFALLPQRGVYSPAASLLWVPIVLGVLANGFLSQADRYGRAVHAVTTRRGTFLDGSEPRANVLNEFFGHMANRPGARGMVVLPEGLTLNYFTGVPTLSRYYLFIPPETAGRAVESEILEEWSSRPPELMVLVSRPLDEYGSAGFGVDYNVALKQYVDREYVVEREWPAGEFSLSLRRRAAP